jgi:GNAT superfamily N-acetyltransferase
MSLTIRNAESADAPLILDFIRALAVYEREPDAVKATEQDLLEHGFGPTPYFSCLIAAFEGAPAGFALFFYDYSTWIGRPGLYLEDLFVHPQFRGRGIGKAILKRLAEIAVERGCARMKWEVLDWNTPAIDFYKSLSGEIQHEWLNVRLNKDALRRLAGADIPAAEVAD